MILSPFPSFMASIWEKRNGLLTGYSPTLRLNISLANGIGKKNGCFLYSFKNLPFCANHLCTTSTQHRLLKVALLRQIWCRYFLLHSSWYQLYMDYCLILLIYGLSFSVCQSERSRGQSQASTCRGIKLNSGNAMFGAISEKFRTLDMQIILAIPPIFHVGILFSFIKGTKLLSLCQSIC